MHRRLSPPALRRAFLASLVLLSFQRAEARTWTTITGEHFEADFVRVEGGNGIFKVKEKDYPYPLNRLSVADRLLIGRTVNQQAAGESPTPSSSLTTPAPSAMVAEPSPVPPPSDAAQLQVAGQPLKAGGSVEIEVPVVDPAGLRETQHAYGKPSAKARMLLAVPENFAPDNSRIRS